MVVIGHDIRSWSISLQNLCVYKYYHRLCGKAMEYWPPKVNEFKRAIWEYVCFDNEGRQDIHVPFDRFRVYGGLIA